MKKSPLIMVLCALAGCASSLESRIPSLAPVVCAEIGYPPGTIAYPGCYKATSETILSFPDSNPEEALKEAKDSCGVYSGKRYSQCVVDAFSVALKAQQKVSDLKDKKIQTVLRGLAAAQPSEGYSISGGTTIYDPSECVGTVIMDVCHGGIIPNAAYHPTCHGEMLNGQCTGPMF